MNKHEPIRFKNLRPWHSEILNKKINILRTKAREADWPNS